MLETQIKLLAAIAVATGVDEEEIKKIINDRTGRTIYEYLIGEDDDSKPPDIDD